MNRQLQFGVMTANRHKVEGVMRPSNSNKEAGERGVAASVVLKRSLSQKSTGKIRGGKERSQGDQLEGYSNKGD